VVIDKRKGRQELTKTAAMPKKISVFPITPLKYLVASGFPLVKMGTSCNEWIPWLSETGIVPFVVNPSGWSLGLA
jgi:hypothetical protein